MGEKPGQADEGAAAERTMDKSSPLLMREGVPVKDEEGRFLKVEGPAERGGGGGNVPIKSEAGEAYKDHRPADGTRHVTGTKFEPGGPSDLAVGDAGTPADHDPRPNK